MFEYTSMLRKAMHNTFRYGQGTRDMSGPTGLTTEQFVDKVGQRLTKYLKDQADDDPTAGDYKPDPRFRRNFDVDEIKVKEMFEKYDADGSGNISFDEFVEMTHQLGIAPKSKLKTGKEDAKVDETETKYVA